MPCCGGEGGEVARIPVIELFGYGLGVATELERFSVEALRHQHGFAQVQQISLGILHVRRGFQYLARFLARKRCAVQRAYGIACRADRLAISKEEVIAVG